MLRKPVVFYRTDKTHEYEVGSRAIVWPINHHSLSVSGKRCVLTSTVLTVLPNGVFETHNSIYKPQEMQ